MKINKKSQLFIYNLLIAFAAQGVSLLVSFFMSLIVPKLLGVSEFSYWQLFIFYSGYVGFFHFGLNDGIYLKYGGKPLEELDGNLLGSQFWISTLIQTIMAGCISAYALFFVDNNARIFVFLTSAICMIIVNASGFIGYIFQAVNLTKLFSLSVIIDKVFFLFSVLILLLFREQHFEVFVILYIVSKLISLVYCLCKGKSVIFTNFQRIGKTLNEIWKNMMIGINLMVANIASMLILGLGQFFIDHKWGIETFGKFSFSLQLTNLFLIFLAQFSMVLFPALRQLEAQSLYQFYRKIRDTFSIMLTAIPLLYVPISFILGLWLPQYTESLRYMIILLPLCIFEGKMQALGNTYLKVLRKERILLMINIVAMVLSLLLILISVYFIQSTTLVVLSMVIAIMLRSIIADYYLSRKLSILDTNHLLGEIILSVIFISTTWFLPEFLSFSIYLVSYIIYISFNKKIVKQLTEPFLRKFISKKI